MLRWNCTRGKQIENPKIDAFIADILLVYGKHGLSISHEDGHGAFMIEENSTGNVNWLQSANDNTDE